ncbi:MAG: hypothetical protein PHI42_08260 [Paludibacteraceae bacterium]|nr:hypothetical protein [Paludibacteraceae bacterium]
MKHVYIFIFLLFLSTNLFGNTILKDSVLAERQQAGMTSTFSQSDDETVWIESHPVRRVTPKFEFGACFGVDLIPSNFDEFQTIFNSYNTELLNGFNTPILLGISGNFKHYALGLQFGSAYTRESSYDSLKIKLNTTVYGINLGYNFIDSKHWVLSPLVSFKWYRYRLLNSSKTHEIPLSDYLQNRDLDIRMNQAICITGINIAYKLYKYSSFPCDFWTIGLQAGYPFKLHDKPLIYSKQNRLTSDYKIDYGNYYLTFYFSFNLQIW